LTSAWFDVNFAVGIHGRPAARLVQLARARAPVRVRVVKDGREADAASLIGLLALGITRGSRVEIRVDGENESLVLNEIMALFAELGEKETI